MRRGHLREVGGRNTDGPRPGAWRALVLATLGFALCFAVWGLISPLAPQFQQVARSAEVGSVSTPIRTPLGLHLLAVCGRRVGGLEAPSQADAERRLRGQNLAVLERRYLRDLRNDALIEVK